MEEKVLEQLNEVILAIKEVRKDQIEHGKFLAIHGEKLSSIDDWLKELNGKVARHELAIHEQAITCSQRQNLGNMIPDLVARVYDLEKEATRSANADAVVAATAATKEKVDNDWKEKLKPYIIAGVSATAGAIMMLVLKNAELFLPAVAK